MVDSTEEEASITLPRKIPLKKIGTWVGAILLAAGITNLGDLLAFLKRWRGDGRVELSSVQEARCCTDSLLRSDVSSIMQTTEETKDALIAIQRMMLKFPEMQRAARKDKWLDSVYQDQEKTRRLLFDRDRRRTGRRDKTKVDTLYNLARIRHEAAIIK